MRKNHSNHLRVFIPLGIFVVLAFAWLLNGPPVSGSPLFLGNRHIYLPGVINNYKSPPPVSTSRYIKSTITDGQMETEGCTEGSAGRADDVVILDFGRPSINENHVYGTDLYPNPDAGFVRIIDITNLVKSYVQQYIFCNHVGASHLTLGVGAYNSPDYTKAGHGGAWAVMINTLDSWAYDNGYSNKVLIVGAMDFEQVPEEGYAQREDSLDWANGYNAQADHFLYNFGACEQCYFVVPNSSYSCVDSVNCKPGGPTSDWTLDDVYYVSWHMRSAWPLPQIYNTVRADAYQWQYVSLYGYNGYNSPIDFLGALTQQDACDDPAHGPCPGTDNTPEKGWEYLYEALNSNEHTGQDDLQWSTDITWDN